MEKKWLVVVTLLILLFNVFWLLTYNQPDEKTISGFFTFVKFLFQAASSIGRVFITLSFGAFQITIVSPQNITYNFTHSYDNFTLDLNVSSLNEIQSWWYSLYDARHLRWVRQTVPFTPNVTFSATRWNNLLYVYANNSEGTTTSANVSFFVYVPNSAPVIAHVDPEVLVCEDNYLSYYFNVTDVDEDNIELAVNPLSPFWLVFFVAEAPPSPMANLTYGEMFSGILGKSMAGRSYGEEIAASDGQYMDTAYTNVTVIEINHAPSVSSIPAQTVWIRENFTYRLVASDTEDGNYLNYSVTTLNGVKFVDINSSGYMNSTPNESQVGTYNVQACALDQGIALIHSNVSILCGQDGKNMSTCITFNLTVTDLNRQPNITSYYPGNKTFNTTETAYNYFNITTIDPDGTTPTAYWWLDNTSLIGYDVYNFSYYFPRGTAGSHFIRVEISDGELNDSVTWFIEVAKATPLPPPSSGSGGGGGAGVPVCKDKWICGSWSVCQNLDKSRDLLVDSDAKWVEKACGFYIWDKKKCGFQVRMCYDIFNCSTFVNKPIDLRECEFSENPSCRDGIKNCHDGSCETLVDCGGPCPACPTCSDRTQNQAEEGVDCGGPCPWPCTEEKPWKPNYWPLILMILIIILLLAILIKWLQIRRMSREAGLHV